MAEAWLGRSRSVIRSVYASSSFKTATVGAAGGVLAPWVGSVEARAAAGVTRVGSERGMPVLREGGLSEERLERLHEVMAGYVERGVVPGIVTLVSRGGDEDVAVVGTTAVGGDEPMTRDTIFRIASMSKPITAVAAMILVEECKLRLDEPVDRLLPELADRQVLKRLDGPIDDTVPANRPITVRDLLTFRLGFGFSTAVMDEY